MGLNGTLYAAAVMVPFAVELYCYHHFPNGKAQLVQTALEASGRRVQAALPKAFEDAPDATTALERWITGLVKTLEGDPRRGCPIAPTALEAAGVSEEIRAAADTAFMSWRSVMEEELGREMPAERAAQATFVVLAAIEGALLLDRTGRRTEALRALGFAIPRLWVLNGDSVDDGSAPAPGMATILPAASIDLASAGPR